MNHRIKKKKQKLAAMHASKWKYAKLGRKHAHAVYIQTKNCMWGMVPHKDNYAMYLRRKRRYGKLESKIIRHILSAKSLILKEGHCNFEKKPLPDGFVRGRIWNNG